MPGFFSSRSAANTHDTDASSADAAFAVDRYALRFWRPYKCCHYFYQH
jgi:hypothetical protein